MRVRLPSPFSFEKSKNLIIVLLKRASDFVGSKSCWNETNFSVRTASVVGFITHKQSFVQLLSKNSEFGLFLLQISGKLS